jgi:hypothetical protein
MSSTAEERSNRYAAAIATLVGVLALLVSGYTAYVQRQQVRAQVWPILVYGTGNEPRLSLWLTNKGMGPARIRHVIVTVDGEPVPRWRDMMVRLLGPGQYNFSQETLGDAVMAPGEELSLFEPRDATTGAPLPPQPDASLGGRFNEERFRVGVEICYCSTLSECWTLRAGARKPPTTTETSRCPSPSARTFTQ